ncbi:hypothetical protein FQN57_000421 [Myotisia sp. PD_48]|nr:hypothetical protein FQN57_000421 [Myotisia sp. PD_48]
MGRTDQEEERETLKSIYPNEITGIWHLSTEDISDNTYRISLPLDASTQDGDGSEPPVLVTQITYPEEYPDVAPNIELFSPPNAPKHPNFDIQEDRERLLDSIHSIIEENLGFMMVFSIVDSLKEGAELLIAERRAAIQAVKDFAAVKAEEEENRKFHGTQVTRESFLEWREKFILDMKEAEEKRKQEEKEAEDKKRKSSAKEPKRLTGKQLWERGMAGKGDIEDYMDDSLLESLDRTKLTV